MIFSLLTSESITSHVSEKDTKLNVIKH